MGAVRRTGAAHCKDEVGYQLLGTRNHLEFEVAHSNLKVWVRSAATVGGDKVGGALHIQLQQPVARLRYFGSCFENWGW